MDGLGQIVDFVLEFLHIAMSFIILGRVLVVTPVELLVELVLGLLDLQIYILDDLIHVLPLSNLTQDVSLELKHWLFDDPVIEVDHVGGDLSTELWILVHDRLQLLLAKAVPIDMVQCLVEELRLLAKEVFVTANNRLLAQLDVEVALPLIAEADAVLA